MATRILHLAAYDVSSPKRLRRALRVLKRYATGGQKSVFECFVTQSEKACLLHQIRMELNLRQDRFFLLRMDNRCRTDVLGIAVRPADPDFYYVG